MKSKLAMFFLLSSGLILSCNQAEKTQNKKLVGIDLASLDSSISPCTDFYKFANGTWLKNNPVPETEIRWGGFNILRDKNNAILRDILEKAMNDAGAAKGSNAQKLGDFFYCAMDSVKLEQEGFSPLKGEAEKISNIKSPDDLIKTIAHQHRIGISSVFGLGVEQDAKKNDQYAVYAGQSGLGLPDRDYYLTGDPRSKQLRDEYLTHVSKMFELTGKNETQSKAAAKTVMQVETRMAEASMTMVERRNPEAQYNKMSLDSLKKLSSSLNWDLYLSEIGLSNVYEIIVAQPLFFIRIQELLKQVSLDDWKTYLTWHLIHNSASKLSPDFENENFRFYGTILTGQKKVKPRWERTLQVINNSLGEVLGAEFVKVAFSEESKNRVNEMVSNLIAVFEVRLKNLDWMSDETKKQALTKLSKITRKMGFPDQWRDYSALSIERDSYVMNFFRGNEFEFNRNLAKLGKPIDRMEWLMPPQTVNAYYNPLMNEIVFPAGILQPPFFNPEADDAVNYGSMGAIIGHELTHGFDDEGNKFDADGNLNNWWTDEDYKNFHAKAELVVNQFNNYEVLDSLFVNGSLTLGENIADLGGVSISYDAYQKSLEGKERLAIDGFTPEQRFFLSYGQVWKGNSRPEALRQLVLTNPHSPEYFRVLGPLSNNPEFHKAFGCSDGAMIRPDSLRAKIW